MTVRITIDEAAAVGPCLSLGLQFHSSCFGKEKLHFRFHLLPPAPSVTSRHPCSCGTRSRGTAQKVRRFRHCHPQGPPTGPSSPSLCNSYSNTFNFSLPSGQYFHLRQIDMLALKENLTEAVSHENLQRGKKEKTRLLQLKYAAKFAQYGWLG